MNVYSQLPLDTRFLSYMYMYLFVIFRIYFLINKHTDKQLNTKEYDV